MESASNITESENRWAMRYARMKFTVKKSQFPIAQLFGNISMKFGWVSRLLCRHENMDSEIQKRSK